ncbi:MULTISPECIES: alanine racemase [Flavobacteriaceae]|uniref:alanine racemase n=1 Tax=Flavobacteriaceae TaxID=49546 RepID=UPI0014913F9B|nr:MULTISPECIES: alanine racemase [Allomuricauda]MDC6366848.1 alanine racemase [Muricauda sp. AC10]
MKPSRRKFLKKASAGAIGLGTLPSNTIAESYTNSTKDFKRGINPWIELSRKAYLKNAETISTIAQGSSVLAVLKNNAYGLGDIEVARILDDSPHVNGYALVKDVRCLALREKGVQKPILLMGDFSEHLGRELVKAEIMLSAFSKESVAKLQTLAKTNKEKIRVQLYFDTGLGRMGMPYDRPLDWLVELVKINNIEVTGIFSTLTTPYDFAQEQLRRFNSLLSRIKALGIVVAKKHIAPSQSLLDLTTSHLGQVRPGILLHGSFPLLDMPQSKKYRLQPTFRLCSRVIRVEKLKQGDTIGFSRFYELNQDEWIATVPIGWADGYSSSAENGAKILINGTLYPVVNVNASHCNVVIGKQKEVKVGDVVTLIGPDVPEITPEGFAKSIKGHNYLQINYKESIPKIVLDEFA